MKKPTLNEIKKSVVKNNGTYKKEKFTLRGDDAYTVNGKTMTKAEMVDRYCLGVLT